MNKQLLCIEEKFSHQRKTAKLVTFLRNPLWNQDEQLSILWTMSLILHTRRFMLQLYMLCMLFAGKRLCFTFLLNYPYLFIILDYMEYNSLFIMCLKNDFCIFLATKRVDTRPWGWGKNFVKIQKLSCWRLGVIRW